jgi:uncharacterized protein (DUF305 family)
MKHHSKQGIASILPLFVLVLSACTTVTETPGVTPAMSPTAGTSEPSPMIETLVDSEMGASGEIDELFIDMMIPHHEGAVAMAGIAKDRSQRPEILEMANAIISAQEEEITQMRAWKQEWYGSSDTQDMSEMPMLEEMPGMGGMGHTMNMQADVGALQEAPEPFDLAFIDAMIPHHQSAIDAAEIALQEAVHPEIRELAQGIIEAQQAEIEQMLDWRAAWFPDAPPL